MVKFKGPPYTKKEEEDFYRRNGGGPVMMTSMTRGRGFLGHFPPHYDWHLMTKRTWEIALWFHQDCIERYGAENVKHDPWTDWGIPKPR